MSTCLFASHVPARENERERNALLDPPEYKLTSSKHETAKKTRTRNCETQKRDSKEKAQRMAAESESAADDLIRSTACFGKDENLTPEGKVESLTPGGKVESRTPEGQDENLTQKRPRKPHCKLENEFAFAKKDKF